MARRRRVDRQLREERERKYRLRARTSKFIPAPDRDFARMARTFATHIARHAERFSIPPQQVDKLNASVEEYRDALSRAMRRVTAGPRATSIKNDAREEAEKIVRAVARTVRGAADGSLTSFDRMELNLNERPERLKVRECPQIAPVLRFVEATSGGGGKHVLEYRNDFDYASNAKPRNAARLELFCGLCARRRADTDTS